MRYQRSFAGHSTAPDACNHVPLFWHQAACPSQSRYSISSLRRIEPIKCVGLSISGWCRSRRHATHPRALVGFPTFDSGILGVLGCRSGT
jgi:hypothetical protein